MKKLKQFEVPILNSEYKVYVFIGDRDKANKSICEYLEEKGPLITSENRGRSMYRRGFHPCIWIDGEVDFRTSVATISHEAIHAVSDMMGYLGMDPRDTSGNEFLAHSVAAVMREVLKNVKK